LWRVEADKVREKPGRNDPLIDSYKIFEVSNKKKEREEGK
jgi:hypothetical protein